MKNQAMVMVMSLTLVGFFLSSCGGGKNEDFDKATFLLSQGGGVNGLKASAIVQPYLSSADVMTRIRAARIFAGGKINAAGLDGAKFLANMAHGQSGGNTINLLKNILVALVPVKVSGRIVDSRSTEEAGIAAETYLQESVAAIESVRSLAAYVAITSGNVSYCSSNKRLCREKESLEVVLANSHFFRALNVAIRLSSLGSSAFKDEECLDFFQTSPSYINTFSASLFSARSHYALAGLDDKLFEGANGALDAENSKPGELIDDVQNEVDPDKDGLIPGTELEKAGVICDYLKTQE